MRIHSLVTGLVATLIPSVTATALTYKLEAHEKACFYADVPQADVKVAFYFAVKISFPSLLFSKSIGTDVQFNENV